MYNCISQKNVSLLVFLFLFHMGAYNHSKYQQLCFQLSCSYLLAEEDLFWQSFGMASLKCLNWRKLKRVISHETDTKYGDILAHTLKVELRAFEWVFRTKSESQWDHHFWVNFDNASCAMTAKIYPPKSVLRIQSFCFAYFLFSVIILVALSLLVVFLRKQFLIRNN